MVSTQLEKKEEVQMGYFEDFESALNNHNAPTLLRLWEEYTSSDELDAEDIKAILKAVKSSDLAEYIGRHIERILPLWKKIESGPISDEILKLIIDLEMTNGDVLRGLAFDYLEKTHQNDAHHNEKMRLVGLRGKNEDFKGAITNYDLLNHLKKGNYVFHTGGWGVGEVVDVSFVREQASFEFDFVPGRKDISFKNSFNCLIAIPNDHFLALRFGNPDLLEEKARNNPVEVIHILLRDLGPKTASEIKDELCDLIIPAKEWPRWWQVARTKVKKNTFIDSPEDLNKPFRLFRKEISHEERLHKSFEQKPDANALIQMVYSFLKDFSETVKNPEFKQSLITKLSELLSFPEITQAQKLQVLFLLQDLSGDKDSQAITQLLQSTESLSDLIKLIPIQSFKKRALIETRKYRQDWKEIFLNLLFIVDQNLLKDYLLGELISAKVNLVGKLEDLCAHPSHYPETTIWYFQKILEDSALPLGNKEGKSRFFESLLILLSFLEQAPGQRELIKKIHGILSDERYACVRKIMKEASLKDVQEFLLLSTKCHSLSDHDIKIFHSLAEVAHPSLAKKQKRHAEPEAEDQVIWTTPEGYQKVQKRIEQIATVETVENAKEIEVARAHGDLRENAEFKSALERRDRLQAELKFLSDQLNRCRILTKEDITPERAGVGMIVDCQNKKGEKLSYTILGPWDADPERGILSFQSKLAKSMNNLKVGDKFSFQSDEYKITGVRSYIQ